MRRQLTTVIACALLGACGDATQDAPQADSQAPATPEERTEGMTPQMDRQAGGLARDAVDTLDRARQAAWQLENAAQERAEEAARVARQKRVDGENSVRQELARMQRQRDAASKARGEANYELQVSDDDS